MTDWHRMELYLLKATCFVLSVAWLASSLSAAPPGKRLSVSRVKVIRDQAYVGGGDRAEQCDVYLPRSSAPPEGRPAVVVVHGGGWVSGDKSIVSGYAVKLAQQGMVAIAINYHFAPKHKFPVQADDIRSALIWTRRNAAQFAIDVDRIGLFGYSAGGHLSTLIGSLADESLDVRTSASRWPKTDPRWQELPVIRAVCAGGPPVDFRETPLDVELFGFFLGGSRRQNPDVYIAASPAAHVSAQDPPTQIIHGEADFVVPISGSRSFHQAQLKVGIDSQLEVLPNQGHLFTFINPKTADTMSAFFRRVLMSE